MKNTEQRICESCGKPYLANKYILKRRNNISRFCGKKCQYDYLREFNSPFYRGGLSLHNQSGEVLLCIQGKDVRNNQNNVYRALKRVLVEEVIKRPLDRTECVIHLDGNKENNNLDNLYVCSNGFTRSIFRYKTKPMPIKSNLDTYK